MHAYMHTYIHTFGALSPSLTVNACFSSVTCVAHTGIHTYIHTYIHACIQCHTLPYRHTEQNRTGVFFFFQCLACRSGDGFTTVAALRKRHARLRWAPVIADAFAAACSGMRRWRWRFFLHTYMHTYIHTYIQCHTYNACMHTGIHCHTEQNRFNRTGVFFMFPMSGLPHKQT